MKVQLQFVLKRELAARNESISSVSKKCKIPVSVLHSWLNGVLPSARNLHHVRALSEYFGTSISTLLFNVTSEKNDSDVVFSSEFSDGKMKYRLLVEKVRQGGDD